MAKPPDGLVRRLPPADETSVYETIRQVQMIPQYRKKQITMHSQMIS